MAEQNAFLWQAQSPAATGPLSGIKLLDLTTVVMGPSATQTLGDLGADIIKVETAAGDSMRWVGPWHTPGMGPLFLQANRNKRSVTLDLKTPEGKARLLALAQQADVLVSNVRPQGLARLGLDYEGVRAVNPRIIYCAAVGYGSNGPNAGRAVYDDLMQAASGISGLFQKVDGTPRYAPINLCDRTVGLYVVIAVTSALYHRTQTGQGQMIEVPMFETMAQFVLADHAGGAAFAPPKGDMGYQRLLSTTRGPYATQNGYIAVVVYVDRHWRDFTTLVGEPNLLDHDPRFATMSDRTRHAVEAGAYLAEKFATNTTEYWLEALQKLDIPCCKVNSLEDLLTDPHLQDVGFFQDIEHPTEGMLKNSRFPISFSASPAQIRRLAPHIGQHNAEIFSESEKS